MSSSSLNNSNTIRSDLENNHLNYNSISTSHQGNIIRIRHRQLQNNQQLRIQQQRYRFILFGILMTISMICIFISYLVSSITKPACSDRIIWMPSCNREEYFATKPWIL